MSLNNFFEALGAVLGQLRAVRLMLKIWEAIDKGEKWMKQASKEVRFGKKLWNKTVRFLMRGQWNKALVHIYFFCPWNKDARKEFRLAVGRKGSVPVTPSLHAPQSTGRNDRIDLARSNNLDRLAFDREAPAKVPTEKGQNGGYVNSSSVPTSRPKRPRHSRSDIWEIIDDYISPTPHVSDIHSLLDDLRLSASEAESQTEVSAQPIPSVRFPAGHHELDYMQQNHSAHHPGSYNEKMGAKRRRGEVITKQGFSAIQKRGLLLPPGLHLKAREDQLFYYICE